MLRVRILNQRTTGRVLPGAIVRYLAGGILASTLLAGASTVGLARYLSRRITTPRRNRRPAHYTFTPWEFQIGYESVRIPIGSDELDAWFMPQPDENAPTVICLSGHGGNKSEALGIASALHRDGFACLLFDFRGTGLSTGTITTLGHYETEDALAAVDWLVGKRPGAPIGIIGYSLGGSVALTVAAIDSRVGAVVSDSAFATQYGILAYHVRRATGLWPVPVLRVAAPMFRRRHQRRYSDFVPAELIHQISPRPLLMIHPEHDTMVPMSEAMQLWNNAREPKDLWIAEGVGHCGAYFEDREAYCRRVSRFFHDAFEDNRYLTS